jgi:hypothetical protein
MRTIALTLTLLAASGLACAQEFPFRKPGLWEITVSGEPKHPPAMQRLCLDRETEELAHKKGATGGPPCKQLDRKTSGRTVTTTSVCDFGNSKVTSTSVVTSSSDADYQMVSDGIFNPPMMGISKTHSEQNAKWVGACPADMHPGDLLMKTPDGREARSNLLKALKGSND